MERTGKMERDGGKRECQKGEVSLEGDQAWEKHPGVEINNWLEFMGSYL